MAPALWEGLVGQKPPTLRQTWSGFRTQSRLGLGPKLYAVDSEERLWASSVIRSFHVSK